jgi:3-oxoacyl-[acyl-carrier-protein] synthase III
MKLAGVSAAVPKNKVKSAAAYANFPQTDVDRIVNNIGVLEHREVSAGQTSSDLCIAAAEPLLEKLGWERSTIDAVVLVTESPDHFMPSSSYRAHHAMKLPDRCMVFDVNLGCSGFTHGLLVMHSFMQSGLVKRGLLMCGEATTDSIRPALEKCKNPSDLGNSLLFGDAGSVCALSNEGPEQIRARAFGADGSGFNHIIVPGGGFRSPWGPELFELRADEKGERRRPLDLILRGPEIFSFSIKRVPPLFDEIMGEAKWTRDDVDVFVFHQANKFMLDFLRKRLKLPVEKVPLSIEEFGNTSCASIPLTMVSRSAERLTKPTKWVMLGFGVGLSWSGVAVETDQIVSLPIIEV